jgi:hypothetical protein
MSLRRILACGLLILAIGTGCKPPAAATQTCPSGFYPTEARVVSFAESIKVRGCFAYNGQRELYVAGDLDTEEYLDPIGSIKNIAGLYPLKGALDQKNITIYRGNKSEATDCVVISYEPKTPQQIVLYCSRVPDIFNR